MEKVHQLLPLVIAGVCSVLLFALVTALIASKSFRVDILGGEGEAKVFGIISVKGVAIVLMSGLFLGGSLYALQLVINNNSMDYESKRKIDQLRKELENCNNERVTEREKHMEEINQFRIKHSNNSAPQKLAAPFPKGPFWLNHGEVKRLSNGHVLLTYDIESSPSTIFITLENRRMQFNITTAGGRYNFRYNGNDYKIDILKIVTNERRIQVAITK